MFASALIGINRRYLCTCVSASFNNNSFDMKANHENWPNLPLLINFGALSDRINMITTAPNVHVLWFPWQNWQWFARLNWHHDSEWVWVFFFGHKLITLPLTLKNQEHLLKKSIFPFFLQFNIMQVRAGDNTTQHYQIHEYSSSLPHDFLFHLSEKNKRLSHERCSAIKPYLLTLNNQVTHPMKLPIDRFLRNASSYSLV